PMSDTDPYYSSAAWRHIRAACLARDGYRCRLCNSPDDLQAHHRTYERFGREALHDLTTLCASCHDVVTDHLRRIRFATRVLPPVHDVPAPITPQAFVSARSPMPPAQEVPAIGVAQAFSSTHKEVTLETSPAVSSDVRGAPLDAQWATQRPAQPMVPGDQKDHRQAQEDAGGPGRGGPAGGVRRAGSLWGAARYPARGDQSDPLTGGENLEKRPPSQGRYCGHGPCDTGIRWPYGS